MRRLMTLLTVFAVAAALAVPAAAGGRGHNHGDDRGTEQELQRDLARLRWATAKFWSIDNVEAAGHQLGWTGPALDHCITHETDGAMGFHYFNHEMIMDTELDPLHPEGIVYAPTRRGNLRLAAVEWIVPDTLWKAEGNTEPPEVMGKELHILNPALGWWILHAWVWMYNPSGVFADWNPRVDCSRELS